MPSRTRAVDDYGNPAPQPAAPPRPVGMTDDQLGSIGQKYLGHALTSNIWQNDANYEQSIANSPEAQAYAARQNASAQPASSAPPAPAAPAAPGGSFNYQQFQNAWLNQRQPGQSAQDFINAHPEFASGATVSKGGEMITLPSGETMDAVTDFGGSNKSQWGNYEYDYATGRKLTPDEAAAQEAQWARTNGVAPGGQYGGSVPGTINGSTSQSTSSSNDPMQAAVQAAILKQLSTLQTPTDGDSSTVHAITDPYHLQNQRGLEATRRALAEQAYASGNLNTGGYGQSQIKAVEDAGANEANFTGQTVATQEAQRMAMLQNILGLGNNSSQFTQQLNATQKNFADQLSQQDRQFAATLAQNVAQYGQSLGYQYALLDWSKTQGGINGATGAVTF